MKQEHFFKDAKWIGAKERTAKTFSVIRGHFHCENAQSATLNILGLGFFKCYINGKCINPDTFLPLSSDYEATCDPKDEIISGHRIYVPQFDITPYITNGDNVIAIHFGGGWYTHSCRVFGLPKAIYNINVVTENGSRDFPSDTHCKIGAGYISEYEFVKFEGHNLNKHKASFEKDFDDSLWENAYATEVLDTDYCTTSCPADALITTLPVTKIGTGEKSGIVYDCGQNTTGYPVLEINAKEGETVNVYFSEELLDNGYIDSKHSHGQRFTIIGNGTKQIVQPEFTWFAFRCFEVVGDAKPINVKVIYADVPVSSTFESDNETLNWTYRTFLHTMLCNMHTGHPSDCPHIERRGYTGDGQLTCHAVLTTMDAKDFYEKWLQDIADCQDVLSGHIQYTAPYIRSGGGPGGWGCAIVEVPYQLYRHYGEKEILARYYGNMRRYIDYLEAHSDFSLVTSDKAGEWCLGDWCGPNILYPDRDITSHNQQVFLPAPMVNTYFMIKSLKQMCEIARILGKDEDIAEYEEKITTRKKAVNAAYFNTFDGNFVMNVQGANAYAVDLGIGSRSTYQNMVNYYKKLGYFDTGIFATDILIRTLFENGNEDLALDLLTNNGTQGYEHWRQNGATTFHEYWDSNRSRSHNHPMFGAPVAYFFEYLLGIRQADGSAGYKDVVIEPRALRRFGKLSGSMMTPAGKIEVSYEKADENAYNCRIMVPGGIKARLIYGGAEYPLTNELNEIVVK